MNESGSYRSKVIALILWFFFGTLGIYNFYLGRTGVGTAQLIITVVGWVLIFILIGFIPLIVVAIWWLVDLVKILTDDNTELFDWPFQK